MRHCISRVIAAAELPGAADSLLAALGESASAHGRMQFAYALRGADGGIELRYVSSQGAGRPYGVWQVAAGDGAVPSLAGRLPLLGWYEREIHDLYGTRFDGHPEPHPLVLHEGLAPPRAPLGEPFDPAASPRVGSALPPTVPAVVGPDIQRLPFGPVRADIVESAQFLFFYIGEGILHYHPRLFYKHRGMEARFEGVDTRTGSVLAERVSGVDSVAHALAFAQAVEGALGWRAPPRARHLRMLLAELERLYNHLHYLAQLSKTTTLKVGEAQGLWLEEQVKQLNARLCGSRMLRALVVPGGLRRDLELASMHAWLDAFDRDIDDYLLRLESTRSHLDRLMTTGVLTRQVAFDQGATGPIERASGLDRDLRRDHVYAEYDKLRFDVALQAAGDAHARSVVRMHEIRESRTIIRQILGRVLPGPVLRTEVLESPDPAGEGLGWAEATRGGLLYAVHLDDSRRRLRRVKIKEPSFSNWRVFPFTLQDSNMMDYAINEASFGLSIAGVDR